MVLDQPTGAPAVGGVLQDAVPIAKLGKLVPIGDRDDAAVIKVGYTVVERLDVCDIRTRRHIGCACRKLRVHIRFAHVDVFGIAHLN